MRRGLVWGLLVAGVLLVALTERWLAPRVVARRSATGEARWIWAAPRGDGVTPAAFPVVRDFTVPGRPGAAELLVLADEEYVLFLNGVRVGGNRYVAGAPLDRYRVGQLLVPGRNRLLVELRSARRAGGLILRLRGEGGLDVVSGPDWRVLRRHRNHDRDPATELEDPLEPLVWGRPPTGRWRLPEPDRPRPLHDEVLVGEHRRLPERQRAGGDWQLVGPLRPALPSLGPVAIFDFGRQVSGFAGVFFDSRQWPKALLYFGSEPPDPESQPPGAHAIGPLGRQMWTDSVPRRFRYLTVVAPLGVRGAYLWEVDDERGAPLLVRPAGGVGVFGVAGPPPLVSPVEHEIRRQLEGLPGLVGGQPG